MAAGTRRGASNAFRLAPVTPSVGFVGRLAELRVLAERLAAAHLGRPQVVFVEAEAGGGKSTLLSRFLSSVADAVVLEVGGDEAETLLSYGVIDQLQPGTLTDPATDPVTAISIVAIPQADLAQKQQQDREDWQKNGVGGLVKSVNAGTGEVVIVSGAGPMQKTTTLHVTPATVLKRAE